MHVTGLRSGVALAVLAVSASVLVLPMAAKAFNVMWPQHSENVANLASDLDGTFQAWGGEPQALAQATASTHVDLKPSLVAARSIGGEPAFGQVFASVSAAGSIPAALQSGFPAQKGGATSPSPASEEMLQAKGRSGGLHARAGGGEAVALALLFSDSQNVSDRQLVHIVAGRAPEAADKGTLDGCEGRERCSIASAPIPGAIWLVVSAIVGLISVGYRRRGQQGAA